MTEAHKDLHFFDYNQLAKERWREILNNAQKKFSVSFDTENDDAVDQREIIIPQKEWDFTKCKFRCEMRSAGGDWEFPVIYFRCQIIEGYANGLATYGNSLFCYIPGKEDGNNHLVKCGKKWCAPTDDDNEIEADEQKCWASLKAYLGDLVRREIDRVKASAL